MIANYCLKPTLILAVSLIGRKDGVLPLPMRERVGVRVNALRCFR